jgi:hypothetical protein
MGEAGSFCLPFGGDRKFLTCELYWMSADPQLFPGEDLTKIYNNSTNLALALAKFWF